LQQPETFATKNLLTGGIVDNLM